MPGRNQNQSPRKYKRVGGDCSNFQRQQGRDTPSPTDFQGMYRSSPVLIPSGKYYASSSDSEDESTSPYAGAKFNSPPPAEVLPVPPSSWLLVSHSQQVPLNVMSLHLRQMLKSDSALSLKMSDEKIGLLNNEMGSNDIQRKGGTSNNELNLSSAVKLIKEQSELLQQLASKLKDEETKNANLEKRLDKLTNQFEELNSLFRTMIEQQSDEVGKLKQTVEARSELQSSSIDELRFQMQSIRNKFDNSRNHFVDSGPSGSPVKVYPNPILASLCDNSSARLHRQNSDDSSTGSTPCLLSRLNVHHRGEMIWRINGFTKKLKKIQSGSYDEPSRSEPFTTGKCGYRLSLWAYLNGRGKGAEKCLSLYVRVVAGEFDPVLNWPIKPCYTLSLISQDPDSSKRLDLVRVRDLAIKHNGIFRPQKDDKSIIVGFDDFIIHEDIEKRNYLLDDSIFIRCVVEISPQNT